MTAPTRFRPRYRRRIHATPRASVSGAVTRRRYVGVRSWERTRDNRDTRAMGVVTPCLVHRCPRFAVHRSRCQMHRESTASRGYGAAHQAARRDLAFTLPAACAYGCGTMLRIGDPWVAAHVIDGDQSAGRVASCRRCNERLGKRGVYPVLTPTRGSGPSIAAVRPTLRTRLPVNARLSVSELSPRPFFRRCYDT